MSAPATLSSFAVLLLLTAGCHNADEGTVPESWSTDEGGGASAPAGQAAATAPVLEALDAGRYTYVQLDVDGTPTWYAAPKVDIAVGETVVVPERAQPRRDFESATLGRTFELVYLVQSIRRPGEAETGPERAVQQAHGMAAQRSGDEETTVDLTGIEQAEGGMTVAEVHELGASGAGQEVVLRGKVVKFNADILGKNWLHVQDGTGGEGTDDLVVTSEDVAAVGDTVLVRGKLAADRDLGFGYQFDLLVEDAAVTVE